MPIYAYGGKTPIIHDEAMVSPHATVLGDVEIGEGASVFPGAVVRGDVAKISVGRYSNVQDNAVLHGGDLYEGDTLKGHSQVVIGDYVTVAHGAVVHGSRVEDVSMIGIRAVVFDGSVIGEGSIIGINAVVLRNTFVPPRSIVVGVPGRVVKQVDEVAYSRVRKHAEWYHKLAQSHVGTLF